MWWKGWGQLNLRDVFLNGLWGCPCSKIVVYCFQRVLKRPRRSFKMSVAFRQRLTSRPWTTGFGSGTPSSPETFKKLQPWFINSTQNYLMTTDTSSFIYRFNFKTFDWRLEPRVIHRCYSPETCKALLNWPQLKIMKRDTPNASGLYSFAQTFGE